MFIRNGSDVSRKIRKFEGIVTSKREEWLTVVAALIYKN